MFTEVRNWLARPFPFVQSYKQSVYISFIAGVFVTMFLYTFKPFGIEQLKEDPLLHLSGYGLITFWAIYFSIQVLPAILPRLFDESTWNILKNILLMIWITFLVSIFNWMYGLLMFKVIGSDVHDHPATFLQNVWMTVSVGVFPILIANYILEKQLFTRNRKLAHSLEESFEQSNEHVKNDHIMIEIPLDRNEVAMVSSNNIICVRAEGGNYATVFWNEENEIRSQLWRITLKNVLELVEKDEGILQCHKSYLVNRALIREVTGNARTLVFLMEGIEFEIPVSRNFPRELVEKYHLQSA
ncbi:MAG: LytTR family transcriptional regulator DNA-binding domain-containing protein [Cyclobacteriaceae bacterium]|nr:LytTR family transcriptional regulator DNA-binding domain-containing protein [Cyclobacteriaceae bacterium]